MKNLLLMVATLAMLLFPAMAQKKKSPLSDSRIYVITFPPPNECVILKDIEADSRTEALYIAVSHGGFTLKPGHGGLTVWTAEEWNEAEKDWSAKSGMTEKEYCSGKK